MTTEIIVQVPDEIALALQPFRDRLPEILARGVAALESEQHAQSASMNDEHDLINLLISQPTPQKILAVAPSQALQHRMTMLLERSKHEALARDEQRELDRYMLLEHLVRLAKIRARAALQ